MKDRLKLTPEQEEKIRPIFQEEVQKMREIRDKYAGQQTREARRSMMTEMKQVRDDMDKQLKDILTKDQMDELQKIRQERQGRMREQRGRR